MILDNYYKVSHKQFQPMYKVQVHLTQTEWLCSSCTPPPAKKPKCSWLCIILLILIKQKLRRD